MIELASPRFVGACQFGARWIPFVKCLRSSQMFSVPREPFLVGSDIYSETKGLRGSHIIVFETFSLSLFFLFKKNRSLEYFRHAEKYKGSDNAHVTNYSD